MIVRTPRLLAVALLGLIAAGSAQAQSPAASTPPPAASPAPPPSPENLALAHRAAEPLQPFLDTAADKACADKDVIGRASDLPPERREKAIAAARPICMTALHEVKEAFIAALAQNLTVGDLRALVDFVRSPTVASILGSQLQPNHGPLTPEQGAALKTFVASPAGADIKARLAQMMESLKATLGPRIEALRAQGKAAACQAAGCPPA